MSGISNVRQGMEVYGSDNQPIGTVEGVQGNGILVNGQLIPVDAVARVAQNRVFLRTGGAQSMSRSAATTGTVGTAATAATGGVQSTGEEVVVPVAEERLHVGTAPAELGEVQIRKTVTEEQVSVPVEVMHEEVHVEERDIPDRRISTADAERLFEGGTIRVPVHGEEAVVEKEAIVTGEVVIEKERLVERQQVTGTVRREQVEVAENYQRVLPVLREQFTQRQAAMQGQQGYTGRTFEQAEPNYRAGFMAASDQQYAGRSFEDVEPDLRRTYETSGRTGTTAGTGSTGSGETWEHLRQEIREGWNRARGSA